MSEGEWEPEDPQPPNPGPLDRVLVSHVEVMGHRNLDCTQYDVCLDVVVISRWRGWSCRGCCHFNLRPKPLRHPTKQRR